MRAFAALLCLLVAILGSATATRGALPEAPPSDPLAGLGLTPSAGVAPGYLPDRVCAMCHAQKFDSYQEVGMARSMSRPRRDGALEDFAHASFVHAASHQRFALLWQGERLLFRRDQLDADGASINLWEQPVDWVMGSGHHARVYLYRTPGGELYQLPIAWYTQEARWGMAPGYDRPDHDGVTRRVRRECMFCHDAYVEAPLGSDTYEAPQTFPATLPAGTGCQRCHGPGAEHVRRALAMGDDSAPLRAAIVNPGRLPPARRDEVCFECHLQPSVALPGVLRFGRGDFSFRPGQALGDFRVLLDARLAGEEPGERFEINHHPYRLRQSRCFLATAGALSCLTCHDPHRKVPPVERPAHYRAACLTCHGESDCKLPPASDEHAAATDRRDCVGCHMPSRRTQDVVHVVMTDHRIQRPPAGRDLLAPLAEQQPQIDAATLLPFEGAPGGALAEIYRGIGLIRAGAPRAGLALLEPALAAAPQAASEPYFDQAMAQLLAHRFAAARDTLRALLARQPSSALTREWLAIAEAGLGDRAAAIAELRQALAGDPDRPEALFNLGHLLFGGGDAAAALAPLARALELRPNLVAATFELACAEERLEHGAEAERWARRTLALDPAHGEAYLLLARRLVARGEGLEALRFLRHGARVARRPEAVAAALAAAEAQPAAH